MRESIGELEADNSPRPLDLEPEEASPFLRAQKRIPARRGPIPKRAADRLKIAAVVFIFVAAVALCVSILYGYGTHSWRFRIDSSDNIEILGIENVSRRQVLDAMGGDIGRNIFFVPLADRKKQLELISWVESAALMRLLPNRIGIKIQERTPVAFVRIGSRVALIDRNGVVMEMPPGKVKQYSFPVITGMGEYEPVSTRSARMNMYAALVRELDSEGAHYSQDLSEVDLSDPEDVKIMVPDPAGAVLVHLGSTDFLRRYKTYMTHAQEWRQQFQKLQSVDLRFDRQIIINPDSHLAAAVTKSVPLKVDSTKPSATKHVAGKRTAPAKTVASAHKTKLRPLPQYSAGH
ncbi:MAG: FtsQ-type POTRA domain-containing protein [Acidobacteria bacterium]|nr:FtsQ-type POTRA domain-containing protein [Acidobacteriota bacterium]